jgi:hypothetical protein
MEPDFQRYLAAKRTVDDRAQNRFVLAALAGEVGVGARVIEVGSGIGSMPARLRRLGLLEETGVYLGMDSDCDNIAAARRENDGTGSRFDCADLFEWEPEADADLLIAAAFLDLVDLAAALPRLIGFLKPGGLAYLPLNFDGETVFEPEHPLDETVLAAYHASMDERPSGGHSRTGRRLFRALPEAGFEILAAGASVWIVHAGPVGAYPADEAYFLHHILHFFSVSCADVGGIEDWLADRRMQIENGCLVYLAHQVDFLGRKPLLGP